MVDRISPSAILKIISSGTKKIVVLEECSSAHDSIALKFANILGIECELKNFYAGELTLKNGNSLYLHASRVASEIALAEAENLSINGLGLEDRDNLKMRCIGLSLAKKIQGEVFDWVLRAEIISSYWSGQQVIYFRNKKTPDYFSLKTLEKQYKNINFIPRASFNSPLISFIACSIFLFLRQKYLITKSLFNRSEINSLDLIYKKIKSSKFKSILVFQENTNIRKNLHLRAQPYYWNEFYSNEECQEILIETKSFGVSIEELDKNYLLSKGLTILSKNNFFFGLKRYSVNLDLELINSLESIQTFCAKNILKSQTREVGFYYLNAFLLVGDALRLIHPLTSLKIKTFIFREPQFRYTDAIDLIANRMDIKTICYQYSNLGIPSPLMTCNAKYMLLFSPQYRKIFETTLAKPGNFNSIGYLYTPIRKFVSAFSQKTRDTLQNNGVNFVICYFDESVQFDKFGLVSVKSHLRELSKLIEFAIDNSNVGIIVKSQYLRNSPSVLYPQNKLIRKLLSLGRYIELHDGHHRNEIYPMEAALSADLCIGHKFGATAILEAAVVGKRGVLINEHKFTSPFDSLYSTCKILYSSIDEILEEIKICSTANFEKTEIGSWKNIINNFSTDNDDSAPVKMSKLIYE